MPTPRASFGIAVFEDKNYCIGGVTKVEEEKGDAKPGGTVVNEVYDPATDTWETKAPIPSASSFIWANTVNGKIYFIGEAVEVYDPETDSWIEKASAPPTAVYRYASTVLDNKIYII